MLDCILTPEGSTRVTLRCGGRSGGGADLFGVCGRLQCAVVGGGHHWQVGALFQDLLDAVDAAALAARADRGAGDGVVAAQAVHLTAGLLAILETTGERGVRGGGQAFTQVRCSLKSHIHTLPLSLKHKLIHSLSHTHVRLLDCNMHKLKLDHKPFFGSIVPFCSES